MGISLEDAYGPPRKGSSGRISYEEATGSKQPQLDQPPAPERGFGETLARGLALGAQGINTGIADTVGFLPDLVAKGTNAAGLTNIPAGHYSKALEEWIGGQSGQPGATIPQPQAATTAEKITEGAGRGIGSAVA